VDLIVGEQKNKMVDRIFNEHRAHHGLGLIPLDGALRGVFRSFKKNRIVALLGDQDARRGGGVLLDFFGHPASVHKGAAAFSLKSGAKIVCCFIIRQGTGPDHRIYFEPALEYEPTGDREKDIKQLSILHTAMLEGWIRKHPDHWFWGHRRWKSTGLYD